MTNLNIAFDPKATKDKAYFVYDSACNRIFTGTYTQCLIIIGGNHLDGNLKKAIELANMIG